MDDQSHYTNSYTNASALMPRYGSALINATLTAEPW